MKSLFEFLFIFVLITSSLVLFQYLVMGSVSTKNVLDYATFSAVTAAIAVGVVNFWVFPRQSKK